jgi:putative sigma-54 modulation protein
MPAHKTPANEPKLIIRGVHLSLTGAMKEALETKARRLFRHDPRIVRLRIEVEPDVRRGLRRFAAKGRVEIAGPDRTATVRHENAYAAINLLIGKLDRMRRRRASDHLRRRVADDIRAHHAAASVG